LAALCPPWPARLVTHTEHSRDPMRNAALGTALAKSTTAHTHRLVSLKPLLGDCDPQKASPAALLDPPGAGYSWAAPPASMPNLTRTRRGEPG